MTSAVGKRGEFKISDHPVMSLEFDGSKNLPLISSGLAAGTNKKLWWKCLSLGHSWEAKGINRYNGSGCPKCSGREAVEGVNSLEATHPDLASEFDSGKNAPLDVCQILPKSHRKVWWLCRKGHSYLAEVCNRTSGSGCPLCSGRNVLQGITDMATTHTRLASEFDLVKNQPLTPTDVLPNTHLKLWWKCKPYGHSWRSTGSNRVSGKGCPKCIPDSTPETLVRKNLSGVKSKVTIVGSFYKTKEVDVWLEEEDAVVEYDGKYWHSSASKIASDTRLTQALLDAGHKVIRIREEGLAYLDPMRGLRQIQFDPKVGNYQTLASDIVKLIEEMETPHAN